MHAKTMAKVKRAARVLAVGVAGACLVGCDRSWVKPTVDVATPAQFKAGNAMEAPPVPDRWVDNFHSNELSMLVDKALSGNLDIAAAIARIEQAEAQAKIMGAPLFPYVELGGSTSRTRTPGTVLFKDPPLQSDGTRQFGASYQSLRSLGLNASYEIDFWGKNRDGADAAERLAEASRYNRSVISLSTVAAVANTYFAMLAAQERLNIAHDNVRIASDVLAVVKKRLAAGVGTSLDLLQQESVLAEQLATIPVLKQTVQQSVNLLSVLVGSPPGSLNIKGGTLSSLRFPAVQAGLPSQLLLRRPDIADAEAVLAASELSVEQARSAMLPSISLTGQYGVASLVLKSMFQPEAIAWKYSGQIAQPLIDGGYLEGMLDVQKGRYAEMLHDYHKQVLVAFSDVDNALIAVKMSAEGEKLQLAAAASSRRAHEAVLKTWQEGSIDILALATSQTRLSQSQDLVAQVRLARLQALVSLYQALGGGWSQSTRAGAQNATAVEVID